MARTQQQRREDTIARLLDASIDTIIEVGYARASAKVITQRAEVSDGALFRYFPTMGDLMAATAQEAGRRLIELGVEAVAEIPAGKPSLEGVLTILRDVTAQPDQHRDPGIGCRRAHRREAAGNAARGHDGVHREDLRGRAVGASADEIATFGEENFAALVSVLINTFNGAAMFQTCTDASRDRVAADPIVGCRC